LVRTAEYARNSKLPTILEMTDAISMNYERVRKISKNGGIRNIIYSVEQSRIASYEGVLLQKFDLSVVVSNFDRDYLLADSSLYSNKLMVCSNGVDLSNLDNNYMPDKKTIIFIGNMTTVQNIDAAKWFSQNVMPLLNKKGNYLFKIIGRINPNLQHEFNNYPGVFATGGVESIAVASQGAFVGVCPMRLGAGVQNKVLEYMAMGVPTITSSLGLEGLEAEPDKDILVADTEFEFFDAIQVLKNDSIAQSISKNGREYVELFHMWESRLNPLVNKIDELIN
jgi:glycosyltransferase involved in cell wall biosynthesis